MESEKFLIYRTDLDENQHKSCLTNCDTLDDDMLRCCRNISEDASNAEERCPNLIHVACAMIDLASATFYTVFYCDPCMAADETGGLQDKLKQSKLQAKACWDKVQRLVDNEQSLELAETIAALEQAVNTLHDQNVAVYRLEQKNAELAEEIAALKGSTSQPTSANVSISRGKPLQDLLERARSECRSQNFSEVMNKFPNLVSSTAQKSTTKGGKVLFSETWSAKNVTLADMATIYPCYEEQEAEADKLTPERLTTIRSNIAALTPFNGDVSVWATFKTSFVQTSKRGNYRAVEDVERLRTLIAGEAYEMFSPELSNPFADPIAILKQLDRFYGLHSNAIRHHLDVISKLAKIQRRFDYDGILKLLKAVKAYSLLCKQFSQETMLTAESSLFAIESKMHNDHISYWRRWILKHGQTVSVDGIAAFLEDLLHQICETPSLTTNKA